MDVYSITSPGVERRPADDLKLLLEQPDALTWVDLPICQAGEAAVLSDLFGFHDLAVRDCVERNHISKMHLYDDHVFVVLHAPELGSGGHVHYIELDQFVGPNYLVTVHGPLNPVVNPDVALIDTRQVLRRIERGEIHPHSPLELSYSIGSALVRREIDLVAALARESGRLEQRVTDEDHDDDPEALLEDLFEVGHQLLAIRTMATHSAETYRGMAKRIRSAPADERPIAADAEGFRGPLGQHVDRPAGVDVDQDGAVDMPLAQREVIRAQHQRGLATGVGGRADEPQQRRAAHRAGQPAGQPGAGPAAQGQRDRLQHSLQAAGPAPVADGQARHLLRERRLGTRGTAAEEPAGLQVNEHFLAAAGGIGQLPPVAAVHPPRHHAAPGAGRLTGAGPGPMPCRRA